MKQGYRAWPIDDSADLHADALTHARDFNLWGRNYYAHARNPPYWRAADGAIDALIMRRAVAERLALVDARIEAFGLKVFLFDAWRPRAVQAYFHDVWMPEELRRRRPDLSEERIVAETQKYWAAPTDDPARPAPHATGGAVDLTLVWAQDGAPLYMGSLFDDATELAATDRFERDGGEMSFSHDEAQANRRLLYWLMIEAEFANHPDEWWHYSFGDQMWAILTGKPAAYYGLATPDTALLAQRD